MTGRPIRTLLVANRGEIACRIIRTARSMGLRTVAVFSDADEDAMHVAMADCAMRIGSAVPRESYLDMNAILHAAQASGADAVHPGYGFLAECAEFAEACRANGLSFIGPPAAAIRAMGDKGRARMLMAKSGVPVMPGHDSDHASESELARAAEAIGFPLLIKASAGGGGKGMRVVASAVELTAALESARREAASAFGDDRIILERYLPHARHVEVQVFADAGGRVLHLFDRDCSVQRRRQKLIEEAPAPGLFDVLRERMSEAAIACAKAVGYVGAGTVEFLVADDQFFFMEMNTRLQVEHPVTEAITGLDLVEWQIRVARGEPLSFAQHDITANGHAIEARLCAESPADGFLPATGRIVWLRWPEEMEGVRVDAGLREGDEVSPYYDSLLAKVIAHGVDRAQALDRLAAALRRTEIVGVSNNRSFLGNVLSDPAFAAARHDTNFVENQLSHFISREARPPTKAIYAAAFAALRRLEQGAAPEPGGADPFSPWRDASGWRLGGRATLDVRLMHGGEEICVHARWREGGFDLRLDGERESVTGPQHAHGALELRIGEERLRAEAIFEGERLTVLMNGAEHVFMLCDARRPASQEENSGGRLSSPLPGVVVAVLAEAGALVEKGAPLVLIEAMKMEHAITAPCAGRIEAVQVVAGDAVAAGAELVVMEADS